MSKAAFDIFDLKTKIYGVPSYPHISSSVYARIGSEVISIISS